MALNQRRMSNGLISVAVVSVVAMVAECRPRPFNRWTDYDFFQAKPVESEASQIVQTVSPLRPYEPWVLDCHLLFTDKQNPGRRHPRCKEVDEQNESEYGKFMFNVERWEEAYPDRAERWNSRFPSAKENEKKKYAQLKEFAESHLTTVRRVRVTSPSPSTTSTQRLTTPRNSRGRGRNAPRSGTTLAPARKV